MLTRSRLKQRRRLLGRDVLSRWFLIWQSESNTWSSLDALEAYLGIKVCLVESFKNLFAIVKYIILKNIQVVVVLVPPYVLWLDLSSSWMLLVLDR